MWSNGGILKALIPAFILTPRLRWSQGKILELTFSNAANPTCAPAGGEPLKEKTITGNVKQLKT